MTTLIKSLNTLKVEETMEELFFPARDKAHLLDSMEYEIVLLGGTDLRVSFYYFPEYRNDYDYTLTIESESHDFLFVKQFRRSENVGEDLVGIANYLEGMWMAYMERFPLPTELSERALVGVVNELSVISVRCECGKVYTETINDHICPNCLSMYDVEGNLILRE